MYIFLMNHQPLTCIASEHLSAAGVNLGRRVPPLWHSYTTTRPTLAANAGPTVQTRVREEEPRRSPCPRSLFSQRQTRRADTIDCWRRHVRWKHWDLLWPRCDLLLTFNRMHKPLASFPFNTFTTL